MHSVFEVSKTANRFGHRLKIGPGPEGKADLLEKPDLKD